MALPATQLPGYFEGTAAEPPGDAGLPAGGGDDAGTFVRMPEVPPIREAMQAFVAATPAEASRAAAGLQEPFGPSGEPLRLEEDEVGSYNPPRVPEILAVLEGVDGLAVAFVERLLDEAFMSPRLNLRNRVSWFSWKCRRVLGPHVLLASDRLARMLTREQSRGEALDLLAASGQGARRFLPELLELTVDPAQESPELIGALAAAVADSAEGAKALWAHAKAVEPRPFVYGVLERLGPRLAGHDFDFLGWLELQVREAGPEEWPPLSTYGSVGRNRSDVIDALIAFCPEGGADVPDLDPAQGWEEDQVRRMAIYGHALAGLAHSTGCPTRVLPLLIHALRRFREYDPDLMYEGEQERVCKLLERFGPAAAPALPEVMRLIEEHRAAPPGQWDEARDLRRLLMAMGAAAEPVLSRLDELSSEDEEEDEELLGCVPASCSWMMTAQSIRAAVEAAGK